MESDQTWCLIGIQDDALINMLFKILLKRSAWIFLMLIELYESLFQSTSKNLKQLNPKTNPTKSMSKLTEMKWK